MKQKKLLFFLAVTFLTTASGFCDATSDTTGTTKQAYIKLASAFASRFSESAKQASSPPLDISQYLAAEKELFLELHLLTNVDLTLMSIANDYEQAAGQGVELGEAIQRLPEHGFLENFFKGAFYGATMQFGAAAQDVQQLSNQDDAQKELAVRIVQVQNHLNASTLLLPMVAKKLSGPNGDAPLNAAITESWGFSSPDLLQLVNVGEKTLHNCTVVITLHGKFGETRRNVHFVNSWPSQKNLYAFYDSGETMFNQTVNRTTVKLIQNVEIALYCDEVTADSMNYVYAGTEKDKDIGRFLDQYFKPKSRYRPFAKGIIFDDQRAVRFSFDGLAYLPKGTLTVSVKSSPTKEEYDFLQGKLVARSITKTQTLEFSQWKTSDTKWVEFKDIDWDPTEWDAQFKFDDTPVTRSYHWVR